MMALVYYTSINSISQSKRKDKIYSSIVIFLLFCETKLVGDN
jgi:hypothetical protein